MTKNISENKIRAMIRSVLKESINDDITLFYNPLTNKVKEDTDNPKDIRIVVTNIERDDSGNIVDYAWDFNDEVDYDNLEENITNALRKFNRF